MIITLLIVLVGLVVYCYLGYPLMMSLLARLRANPWKRDENFQPTVSVILAVYNEEAVIEECLASLRSQVYPHDKVEILVGSDGSSDSTEQILRAIALEDPRVRPYLFTDRRGKIPVVNDLVKSATGEILVFADADITLLPDSIKCHTRHYADQNVGCVAGQLTYRGDSGDLVLTSENDYMSFENKLRRNEALIHSTVGIFGGNYSLRRSEFRTIPDAPICDELFSAMQVIEKGMRTVFDPEAVSPEAFVRTIKDEFKRKSRYAARGFTTMTFFPSLVSPLSGLPSLMLWSHKMLRYLAPFCLIMIAIVSIAAQIAANELYLTSMNILMAAGLCILIVGATLDKLKLSIPGVSHLYWLSAMNLAFCVGTLKFLFGRERKFWTQPTRTESQSISTLAEKEAVQL
jgi:cellulose synthase/poly-beta-1,6-N-acetylglucosamine synthase-like glycosyltransferase